MMIKQILKFILPALLISSFAQAEIEVILSPKKNQKMDPSVIQTILSQKEVKKSRPVFGAGEKNILGKMNADYLSQSLVLTLSNERAYKKLSDYIWDAKFQVHLSANDMKIKPQSTSQSADPFSVHQWAFKNTGSSQNIDLDQMIVYKVPGRSGEDMKLPSSLMSANGQKIVVAVLDTGIDKQHPDLKASLKTNAPECKALEKFLQCTANSTRAECEKTWMNLSNPEVDQDKNGYPMDCQGWSLLGGVNSAQIMGRPDFGDDQGHGTHVAGIIGATSDNSWGIRGVSNRIQILPVQVLGDAPSEPIKPQSLRSPIEDGTEAMPSRNLGDMVARGVIYAMASGAKVINFSMGWPDSNDSDFMRQVIEEAQAQGIMIVAAAGNDSTRALLKPCGYKDVLCVGAHGPDGALSHFSNYGTGVDLVAPGVNILSTYPGQKRSIRFRQSVGFEYLSGTSQATPYVSGVVAALLSEGLSKEEVYARLIASARPTQKPLAVTSQKNNVIREMEMSSQKYSLSGNMDVEAALKVKPQALILPATKDKQYVSWDRQSQNINIKFSLKNYWQNIDSSQVQVGVTIEKTHAEAIRPKILKVREPQAGLWKSGVEREYELQLTLEANADVTRIPSDLNLKVQVQIAGQTAKTFVLHYELLTKIHSQFASADSVSLPIQGQLMGRNSILPIDEMFDSQVQFMDYVAISYDTGRPVLRMITQNRNEDPKTASYQLSPPIKLSGFEDVEKIEERILARMDINGDGVSEYVLGFLTNLSEDAERKPSPIKFVVIDSNFKVVESWDYDSVVSQFPRKINWMKKGNRMVPVWLGVGTDPNRKTNLRDLWENPLQKEMPGIRLYYVDVDQKAKVIQAPEGFDLIDILENSKSKRNTGELKVIFARPQQRSVYLYDFAVAELKDAQIGKMEMLKDSGQYRNLLDARVDRVHNLDLNDEEFAGTYWFGEGKTKSQKLSVLLNEQKLIESKDLKSVRKDVDAALWIRSVFVGQKRQGAFVFTNSELQYHDILNDSVASRSLERYTFYSDMMFTNFHFPTVIADRNSSTSLLPALFTAEQSEINRGIKFLIPAYNKNNELVEIVSPARLRMQAEVGCRPLDTPIVGYQGEATKLDYFCGDKLIRLNLVY